MKFTIAMLALCGLCFTATAQFDPYAQVTLIQALAPTAATNATTAAVGVTNNAIDISGYAGIGSLIICVVSNYTPANAAATCAVWVEGTSVSPTNTAISLWAPLALGAVSTSATVTTSNMVTSPVQQCSQTVFTPGGGFATTIATTNAPGGIYEYGIPISDCPRYLRVNFNTTGLGASYGISAVLKARKRNNN